MSHTYPPVTLLNTEVRMIGSSNVDQEFKILIRLPPDYAESDATYPTIYLTDANIHFGTVAEFIARLTFAQEIPEMIIVGIGYPIDNLMDVVGLRWKDLTPTKDLEEDKKAGEYYKNVEQMTFSSGGGESFLTFIRDDLIPFIDAEYRTEPADRTIVGHSFGGLFALYSLFQQPAIFNRYIVSSPSLWWDNRVVFTYESKFAEDRSQLPVKLFLSVGKLEEDSESHRDSSLYQFTALLKSRNYESLEMEMVTFDKETHWSVTAASLSRGLRTVFRKDDSSKNNSQ